MTRWYRLRTLLLVGAILCWLTGLWWIGSPLFMDPNDERTGRIVPTLLLPTVFLAGFRELSSRLTYGLYLVVFIGPLLLAQWMFLRPRRNWTPRTRDESRPMKTALVAAAFMAMVLSAAWIGTLFELLLPDLWEDNWPLLAVITGGLWLAWAVVFYFRWRGSNRFTWLRTVTRRLIAGSALELFVATAVYAWNPHEEDCWCARGSFTGLVLGATVMLWAFGPGFLFLFLRQQERRDASTVSAP